MPPWPCGVNYKWVLISNEIAKKKTIIDRSPCIWAHCLILALFLQSSTSSSQEYILLDWGAHQTSWEVLISVHSMAKICERDLILFKMYLHLITYILWESLRWGFSLHWGFLYLEKNGVCEGSILIHMNLKKWSLVYSQRAGLGIQRRMRSYELPPERS
jgi:hypothetical protein